MKDWASGSVESGMPMHGTVDKFGTTCLSVFLIWLTAHRAIATEAKTAPKLQPPKNVLRVGEIEAARQHDRHAEALRAEPDIHPHAPELISKQRVVGFPKRGQISWLLLYAIAEVGPRAHTPISQLIVVSEKGAQLLLSLPSSTYPKTTGTDSLIQQADDARIVEMTRGRFALAISHGGQARIQGSVTLLGFEPDLSLKELWSFPGERHSRHARSTIYFLKLPPDPAVSLAVRQHEAIIDGPRMKLVRNEYLYRLDPEAGGYAKADINSARLTRLLDKAERDHDMLRIEQRGTIVLWTALGLKEEAAAQDRARQAAYARLHRRLSGSARTDLEIEERNWLEERDRIEDLYELNRFVADRVRELTKREHDLK
jgi:hypothetical protein